MRFGDKSKLMVNDVWNKCSEIGSECGAKGHPIFQQCLPALLICLSGTLLFESFITLGLSPVNNARFHQFLCAHGIFQFGIFGDDSLEAMVRNKPGTQVIHSLLDYSTYYCS